MRVREKGRNGRKLAAWLLTACLAMQAGMAYGQSAGEVKEASVEGILSAMTLEDKICQMIMPAIRSWEGENLTDLTAAPETAEALRAHQYGGIILYGSNMTEPGQIAGLVQDLQDNNLANENTSVHIPYFMAVDEEGGIVVRFVGGTRMNGSMAIGATGDNAAENAEKTGRVLGEEMAAVGFNVDFAPDIDVNNNAANPVIGTRSFSDDPETVAALGTAWTDGLTDTGVIATYKHFPGHGDTGVDSHIGTPSVEKTYDQIKEVELVPFQAAIEDGADMIMTAHITYPLIDDEVVFGDGVTKGFYPATMSKKMITEILREDLGFDGVVVADALEMDAIRTAGLVPGEEDSVEYSTNIAQKVIEAGVDILLLPTDLNGEEAVAFYDTYIDGLVAMVEDGTIPEARIDESVERILKLKEKYGILDADKALKDPQEAAANAREVLGSDEHHAVEMEIAKQAITLLKNDQETLPITATDQNIVFLGRQAEDSYTIEYALRQLMDQGILDANVQIVNQARDALSDAEEVVEEPETEAVADEAVMEPETEAAAEEKATKITIDYYYDPSAEENKLHYTDALKQAIGEADVVIGFTKTYGLSGLDTNSEQYQGIAGAIGDTHDAGGRFVLLSNNLPYDAARFQDADAILLAYMGSGLDMDPTERGEESGNLRAYNANVVAAIHMMFGDGAPAGTLPVEIPKIVEAEDGSVSYSDEILYERGFGLKPNEPMDNESATEEDLVDLAS